MTVPSPESSESLDYASILDALPGLVWTAGADGFPDFFNRYWHEYVGQTAAGDQNWLKVIHPNDRVQFSERWFSILESRNPGEIRARFRRADDAYRLFRVSIRPLPVSGHEITGWCALGTEINDLEPTSRDAAFDQVVDSIPIPVAVTKPSGEVESLNRLMLEYFGKTLEELKGWKSSEVVHPDDLDRTISAQMDAHQKDTSYDVESRHLSSDGTYRWFNVIGLPLRDQDGQILRWLHLLIDIDDRKRADEKVRISERNLDQTINTIPALAWSARPDGSAEFFNRHYLDYVGLTIEQVQDWGWSNSIHPEDLIGLAGAWQQIMASQKPGETEGRLRRFDGTYRWFLFRMNPLRDEAGTIVKWYGTNTDINDRKEAETLIRENERRFKAIFDEAGTGITLLDLALGEPIQNNRALQRMLQCSEEELGRYETFDRLTAEPDRETDARRFREMCAGQFDTLRMEKHFVLKNGASVWANVIFTLLRDDDERPRYLIAIHEDVTERKRAVERLQAKQDLLDLAQKAARAMAFDWYIQEEHNTWSPEQEALYGLAPGTFERTFEGWRKLVHPEDWPVIVETIKEAHESGNISAEYRTIWPDGTIHWLSANGQMFFDDDGKPFRMVGFSADITARKGVEEELRRSEAFLAEGQHLSQIGNFTWCPGSNELTWSEQLYRIFEFEKGLPLSVRNFSLRLHPDDIPLLFDMLDKAKGDISDFEYEYRIIMPDKLVKHLHMIAHGTYRKDGKFEYIGAVQDVTHRRQSEEALAMARSELAHVSRVSSLGVLTASIAHEVNQPLAGIITNANTGLRMLAADPPNIEGARETARRTIRDGNRAAEVITRLRSLFGKKEPTRESVDLNAAALEVMAVSRSEFQRKNINLQTDLADNLPIVHGDRVQFQQVILNLLLNASDAMSEVVDRPRQLTVTSNVTEDDQVCLSVKDAGAGFDLETMKKLFDPFYTTKASGMGIGLHISRSIIESYGGRLKAELNDGPGATFSFYVPIAATESE